MMHLSKDLSDLNYNRYQNWESPVVESSTIFPAISAFNGEVYKGFDVHTLSKGEIENSQNNLRILSGYIWNTEAHGFDLPVSPRNGDKMENNSKD